MTRLDSLGTYLRTYKLRSHSHYPWRPVEEDRSERRSEFPHFSRLGGSKASTRDNADGAPVRQVEVIK